MSAQLDFNASDSLSTKTEPAACLNPWPLPGWTLMTTPARLRYVRLQHRAEHFEARQCDLAMYLIRLHWEQNNGIDHRARIARVERIARRTQQQISTALDALSAQSARVHAQLALPDY